MTEPTDIAASYHQRVLDAELELERVGAAVGETVVSFVNVWQDAGAKQDAYSIARDHVVWSTSDVVANREAILRYCAALDVVRAAKTLEARELVDRRARAIIDADPTRFMDADGQLRTDLSLDERLAIKHIKTTAGEGGTIVEVELCDRLRALDLLSKNSGLQATKLELSGSLRTSLSAEERAALIQELKESGSLPKDYVE
jgi:hypothetical protein